MAYGTKYQFKFESNVTHEEFQILVQKEGYSGSVIQRALGQAPILRRERNGHVCGTSLEFYPECRVDGEFAEFYTSDPRFFKVILTNVTSSETLFEGFISPELYSEPDIAPPYDVHVTATDGLGELRRYLWSERGEQTLDDHLYYLLGFTGLTGYFYHNNNSLAAYSSNDRPRPEGSFFEDTYIDLDFLVGKPCYDVLSLILDSLHADLFMRILTGTAYKWQILRETDVEGSSIVTYSRAETSPDHDLSVAATQFGSIRSWDWWPVGQMENEIKPANKRFVLTTDAHYKEGFVNAEMTSDSGWVKYNATFDGSLGAYLIASGGGIYQRLYFQEAIRHKLKLVISMRQYRPTYSSPSSAGTARVEVQVQGRTYGATNTWFLVKNSDGEYIWTTTADDILVDLPAPQLNEGSEANTVFEVELPLYNNGGRMYRMAEMVEVTIYQNNSNVPLLVDSASITFSEQIAGYQDVLNIDNGARDEADDVNSLFLPAERGYSTPVEFMYAVPKTDLGTVLDLFGPVAEDYARSYALPRLYKRGTLNVPSGNIVPFVFRDSDGINYLLRTFEWDLLNSEMRVELLSRPAASATISGQEVSEIIYQGGSSSSSGSTSGGGGGGGGSASGVSSVGLEMPEGFVVSSSPITSSGTIRVALGEGRVIPLSSQIQVFNNKAFLDRLTDPMLLGPKPTLRILNKQRGASQGEGPLLIVTHPYLRLGWPCSIVLMVRHKANKTRNKNKNKGWFAAFGKTPQKSPVIDTLSAPTEGQEWVTQNSIKDIIVGNYCHNGGNDSFYPIYDGGPGSWLDECYTLSNSTAVGFNGQGNTGNLRGSLTFGIAIRIDNPEFALQVHGELVEKNTGSINGVPRYFYSDVAPMLATMEKNRTDFHMKGEISLRPF